MGDQVDEAAAADEDRRFHPPSGDHYWTETGWWAFWVPERGLSGSVYTLFRPNLGVVASGVHVWGGGTTSPWDAPYSRTWWHLPLPSDADPTDYELANGLRLERLEAFKAYRFTYDDVGLSLDLTVTGLAEPHRLGGIWFDGGDGGTTTSRPGSPARCSCVARTSRSIAWRSATAAGTSGPSSVPTGPPPATPTRRSRRPRPST